MQHNHPIVVKTEKRSRPVRPSAILGRAPYRRSPSDRQLNRTQGQTVLNRLGVVADAVAALFVQSFQSFPYRL